jgi:nicotinate-nucleotide adenylyltransferase
VFGGTFDPPHVGHRIVAMDVVAGLALDRLLIVPAARPPHRDAILPGDVRLALTRHAFAGNPRVEISDIEFRRDGPSYMVDTLERVRVVHPGARLFLVMGSDQYEGLSGWRRPERIVELADLAVMRRAGGSIVADGRFPFRPVDVTRVDLSSTEIRRRLSAGRSVRYLVPDVVLEDVERAWAEQAKAERATGYETRC